MRGGDREFGCIHFLLYTEWSLCCSHVNFCVSFCFVPWRLLQQQTAHDSFRIQEAVFAHIDCRCGQNSRGRRWQKLKKHGAGRHLVLAIELGTLIGAKVPTSASASKWSARKFGSKNLILRSSNSLPKRKTL